MHKTLVLQQSVSRSWYQPYLPSYGLTIWYPFNHLGLILRARGPCWGSLHGDSPSYHIEPPYYKRVVEIETSSFLDSAYDLMADGSE